jgi:predicted metal-binding membrane protein
MHLVRNTLWLGFFGGILVAWVVLYQMATGMGLDWIGRMSMDMDMGMEMEMPGDMSGEMAMNGDATDGMAMDGDAMDGMAMNGDAMDGMAMDGDATDGMAMDEMDMGGMDMSAMTRFGPLFGMWSIMMAAMMLPTLVPTLVNYERLMTSADGTRAGWLGVLGGYSIVWIGVAAIFAIVQIALLRAGIIDMMGIAQSTWIAGGLLIAVGAFQFTRAKEVCHGVCHAPMNYFLGHWRTGFGGGVRMGMGLGAFCAGCCWGFMALGFVGGMMSLLWMGLATLFMVIEKLPAIGHYVTKPLGVALISGGLGVLAYPYIAA